MSSNLSDSAPVSLYTSCRDGDTDRVMQLIAEGVDVNGLHEHGETPLSAAVKNGHVDIVTALLAAGATTNYGQNRERSVLAAACLGGHLAIVKILLASAAPLHPDDPSVATPLGMACAGGHIDIAQYLLDHGDTINFKRPEGWSGHFKPALYCAIERGHLPMVKFLLNKGADVHAKAYDTCSRSNLYAVTLAPNDSIREDLVRLLLNAGLSPDDRQALENAASQRQTRVVQMLIEAKPNLHGHTWSAMLMTIEAQDLQRLRLLIAAGFDVDEEDERDYTPLTVAIECGQTEMVRELLAAGADIEATGPAGNTPLQIAAKEGQVASAELLIAAGANIDFDEDGDPGPPLLAAAYCGHIGVVKLLLDAGADIDLISEGGTALGAARDRNHQDIVNLLLSRGASDQVEDREEEEDDDEDD